MHRHCPVLPCHLQLYRRSLRLTKAHEHDVDSSTQEEPSRTIRDISATFTLGLTSELAQKVSFRCAALLGLRCWGCTALRFAGAEGGCGRVPG